MRTIYSTSAAMDPLNYGTVQWSDDHLSATLTCRTWDQSEPAPWSADELTATWLPALTTVGVVFGVDATPLHATLAAWLADGAERTAEIAHGVLPLAGLDGHISCMAPHLVTAQPAKGVAGQSRPWSKLITNVAAGTRLAQCTPPTSGTPGYLVTGEEIPATPGAMPSCERSAL